MGVNDQFNGNLSHDCDLVWNKMSSLKLDSNEFVSDRGLYRMYFSFVYNNKKYNAKAFYNHIEPQFMFTNLESDFGFTQYEWEIIQNVIAVVTKNDQNL